VECLQQLWIKLIVVLQDEGDLLEVLGEEVALVLSKDGALVESIVVSLNVKYESFIIITVFCVFYNKGHVTER
jgi:hypothetical protein